MLTPIKDIKTSPSMIIDPRHIKELFTNTTNPLVKSFEEPMEYYIQACDAVAEMPSEERERLRVKHFESIENIHSIFKDYRKDGAVKITDVPVLVRFLGEVGIDFMKATGKFSDEDVETQKRLLQTLVQKYGDPPASIGGSPCLCQ